MPIYGGVVEVWGEWAGSSKRHYPTNIFSLFFFFITKTYQNAVSLAETVRGRRAKNIVARPSAGPEPLSSSAL
jgi:hypothetical protein